jgi:tripartite-type tricarboxylate transporter receptor subunit TctC
MKEIRKTFEGKGAVRLALSAHAFLTMLRLPRPKKLARCSDKLRFARLCTRLSICTVLSIASLSFAKAQETSGYPVRPVRIIVAAAAGGNPDLLSRILAQRLFEKFGKPFVVENMPGAGGLIAAKTARSASPDGYTLTIIDAPGLSNSSALSSSPEPNPGMEITAVASLVSVPTVLVVRPELQAKSLQGLVALAKARPGELAYGSAGQGSIHQLTMLMFENRSGINLLEVPYRGGSALVNGLLTGEIQAGWAGIPNVAQLVETGQVRALCVSTLTRSISLPDVPTCSEAGYPGFQISTVLGLHGPPGLPKPLISVLEKAFLDAIGDPGIVAQIHKLGMEVRPAGAAEYAAFVSKETARYQNAFSSLFGKASPRIP